MQENKNAVARWFREFWGNPWNPRIVNELATSDIFVHYPMHEPKKGRAAVLEFMTEFRDAFPDLNFRGVGELIAEADFVVGRCPGVLGRAWPNPYPPWMPWCIAPLCTLHNARNTCALAAP